MREMNPATLSVWEANISHGLISAASDKETQLEPYLQHLKNIGYPKWVIVSGWNKAKEICFNPETLARLEGIKPYMKDRL